MPWAARSAARLTTMAAVKAIRGPGNRWLIRRPARTITMTPADTATSASCACGIARSVSRSLGSVCGPEAVTPSMAGSCPAAT